MERDRTEICKIISEMLEHPDSSGIYPTSTAYIKLEHYIEQERIIAIGWTHAGCCVSLDRGNDPRVFKVPKVLEQARKGVLSQKRIGS